MMIRQTLRLAAFASWMLLGSTSLYAICGDGLVDANETCDDTNTSAGDGCDASCMQELGWNCGDQPSICEFLCGDGVLQGNNSANQPEICDDGNQTTGDGCDDLCQTETGYSCTDLQPFDGIPGICTADNSGGGSGGSGGNTGGGNTGGGNTGGDNSGGTGGSGGSDGSNGEGSETGSEGTASGSNIGADGSDGLSPTEGPDFNPTPTFNLADGSAGCALSPKASLGGLWPMMLLVVFRLFRKKSK